MIRKEILKDTNQKGIGYAFGLGIDRLAMILFNIPDIRLFWSQDERFLSQFKQGKITKFEPYSKFPACYKDITFWIPNDFVDNDFFEIIRNIAGDLVENVKLIDEFQHPKTGKKSKCFRILYRHMDRSLTNEEIDVFQFKIRDKIKENLKVELR